MLDASVLVEYLAGGPGAPTARERILVHRGDLWAPHLVDAEVGHALRRLVALEQLSARTASAALDDLTTFLSPERRTSACFAARGGCATT